MKVKSSKGFTLAEMLIVMAVAVVLAAAAIPSITGQIEKAKEANDAMAIAGDYANGYASAALAFAQETGASSTTYVGTTDMKQATNTWEMGAPTIGGQPVPGISSGQHITYSFSVDASGATTLTGMTAG